MPKSQTTRSPSNTNADDLNAQRAKRPEDRRLPHLPTRPPPRPHFRPPSHSHSAEDHTGLQQHRTRRKEGQATPPD